MTDAERAAALRATLAGMAGRKRLETFAELLATHDAGRGWPGGNVRECAAIMGLDATVGNAMLQRIRRGLEK